MEHTKSVVTFNELIDIAVQALKDNVLETVNLNNSGVRSLKFRTNADADSTIVFDQHPDYLEATNYIKSLYTETFVIECDGDIRKIKKGAIIEMQHGNEVVAESGCKRHYINYIQTTFGSMSFNLNFVSLKGATVTQKKGIKS